MRKLLVHATFVALLISILSPINGFAETSSAKPKYDEGNKRYNKVLDSWMGGDINDLIESWGPPERQYRMPNGNMLFTWVSGSSSRMPMMIDGDFILGGDVITYSCKTTFSVSSTGRIFNWQWEGNSCRQRK